MGVFRLLFPYLLVTCTSPWSLVTALFSLRFLFLFILLFLPHCVFCAKHNHFFDLFTPLAMELPIRLLMFDTTIKHRTTTAA